MVLFKRPSLEAHTHLAALGEKIGKFITKLFRRITNLTPPRSKVEWSVKMQMILGT